MDLLSTALAHVSHVPATAREKLDAYVEMLRFYNKRVNLISREDEQDIRDHHVAHCVMLGRKGFPEGHVVVDWGTGGGLPLIPLAVLFPQVTFIGVDAVEKKTLAVSQMSRSLSLDNVSVWHGRAEQFTQAHSYSVSRATAPLAALWRWHRQNAQEGQGGRGDWPAGLICLKGGELDREVVEAVDAGGKCLIEPVGLKTPYYTNKFVVCVTT